MTLSDLTFILNRLLIQSTHDNSSFLGKWTASSSYRELEGNGTGKQCNASTMPTDSHKVY